MGMNTIIMHTDGGARGNPGPAAIGIYVTSSEGEVVVEHKQAIGNATNNYAEYQAVLIGLELLKKKFGAPLKDIKVIVKLDSELVQRQLSHEYQIKDPTMVALFIAIHNLRVSAFGDIEFVHVPRAENKDADRLVNEALDGV